MTVHLLPPSASAAERALSIAAVLPDDLQPERIKALWNPHVCPIELLPWLAWSWHVDDWDESWSEEIKRAFVTAAWEVHRFKGTPWAVRRALEALEYRAEIDESTGVPYVLDLSVELTGPVDIGTFTTKAVRCVEITKPVSRHLRRITNFVRTAGRITAASVICSGTIAEVWPMQSQTAAISANAQFCSGIDVTTFVEVWPKSERAAVFSPCMIFSSAVTADIIIDI